MAEPIFEPDPYLVGVRERLEMQPRAIPPGEDEGVSEKLTKLVRDAYEQMERAGGREA